jgi:phospholipid/cholesterol/gamma-HCH transport system ATP-binding protein
MMNEQDEIVVSAKDLTPCKMVNESDDIVISVKDLSIGYGERVILEKVNFQVKRGEVFVILGESGCGKSTLMKTMIGL